jgi:hypothetical protein
VDSQRQTASDVQPTSDRQRHTPYIASDGPCRSSRQHAAAALLSLVTCSVSRHASQHALRYSPHAMVLEQHTLCNTPRNHSPSLTYTTRCDDSSASDRRTARQRRNQPQTSLHLQRQQNHLQQLLQLLKAYTWCARVSTQSLSEYTSLLLHLSRS